MLRTVAGCSPDPFYLNKPPGPPGCSPQSTGLFAYWVAWRDRPRIAWLLAKCHFALVWAYLLVQG